MSQKNIEKLKRKIAALLAKAGGTDNEHEAASFAAKAQALLAEHQLEIGDVIKTDPIERSVICVMPKTSKNWHWLLPKYLCKFYGCEMFRSIERDQHVMVAVGRESARITTVMMFPYVLKEVRAAAAELRTKTLYSSAKCMQLVVDNFCMRVMELLEEQAKQAKAAGGSDGRSLIQLNDALVWLKDHVDLKHGKQVSLQHDDDARALADGINLGLQVNTAGEPLMAIGDK